jgi:hypothetical protein
VNKSEQFFEKVDNLKLFKDFSDHELASEIGISRSLLHAMRVGKKPISQKTWFKLEQAERRAGLIEPEEEKPVPQERPPPAKPPPDIAATCAASFQSLENELHQLSNHWKKFQALEKGHNTLEKRMERLESMLEELLKLAKGEK